MAKELPGYRDELEYIISRLGNKGWYTTDEISRLDCGEAEDPKTQKKNLRTVRARYQITDGGLTPAALARKRALLSM